MASGYAPIFVRAYDFDFDRVALNPKLTHEEKIRLLVQMQHVWTDGRDFFADPVSREQIDLEIQTFRPEIEERMLA